MRKGPWSDRWPGILGEGREGGQEDTGLTCELRLGAQRPRRGEEGRGREEGAGAAAIPKCRSKSSPSRVLRCKGGSKRP